MLTRSEDVEADFFCLQRNLSHRVNALMLRGGLAGGGILGNVTDGHDSELHCVS